MEDIKIKYFKDEEYVLLNYFDSSLVKKNNNEKGSFSIENNILSIIWNDINIEEKFEKINNDSINNDIESYQFVNKNIDNCISINNDTYIILNNYIYEINNRSILFDYKIIIDSIIGIKFNNYYQIFQKNENNIYNDVTEIYNIKIRISHNNWTDDCIINKYNNFLYRVNNCSEYGIFELNNNKLKIYWEKWDSEIFINKNDIYYLYDTEEVMIYHKNWEDLCNIDKKYIYRREDINDFGKYKLENNILTIYWEKWSTELFYYIEKSYFFEFFIKFLHYKDNDYIVNLYNNNIYELKETYINSGNIFIENNKISICIHDNKEEFYYKYNNSSIIIYKENFINITLVKKYENIIKIDLLENEYDIFQNNRFTFNNENYIRIDNKYYYEDYLKINDKDVLLIDNNKNIHYYKINYYYNYFYKDELKIYFLENNNLFYFIKEDILEEYYLNIIDDYYIFVLNKLQNNDIFNLELYRENNKDLYNLTNKELFLNWICNRYNEKRIFSVETFLKKNSFFDINGYINNNYHIGLKTNNDAVLHFIDNRTSIYFYSNQKIEVIYDNIIHYEKKIYDDIIFIINLDYIYNINELLSDLPKNSIVIININIENNKIDNDFENNIINNFTNLVITKSYNLINYYILDFIVKEILIKKNVCNNKIIYLNRYYTNFYKTILNIPTIEDNDKVIILNNDNDNSMNLSDKELFSEKNYYTDYNYLFDLLKIVKNKIDIIQILIFYYISKRNIYNLGNCNFIISLKILKEIIGNNFSKKIVLLV